MNANDFLRQLQNPWIWVGGLGAAVVVVLMRGNQQTIVTTPQTTPTIQPLTPTNSAVPANVSIFDFLNSLPGISERGVSVTGSDGTTVDIDPIPADLSDEVNSIIGGIGDLIGKDVDIDVGSGGGGSVTITPVTQTPSTNPPTPPIVGPYIPDEVDMCRLSGGKWNAIERKCYYGAEKPGLVIPEPITTPVPVPIVKPVTPVTPIPTPTPVTPAPKAPVLAPIKTVIRNLRDFLAGSTTSPDQGAFTGRNTSNGWTARSSHKSAPGSKWITIAADGIWSRYQPDKDTYRWKGAGEADQESSWNRVIRWTNEALAANPNQDAGSVMMLQIRRLKRVALQNNVPLDRLGFDNLGNLQPY